MYLVGLTRVRSLHPPIIIIIHGIPEDRLLDHRSTRRSNNRGLSAWQSTSLGFSSIRQLHRPRVCLLQVHHHLHQASRPSPLWDDLPCQKDIATGNIFASPSRRHWRESWSRLWSESERILTRRKRRLFRGWRRRLVWGSWEKIFGLRMGRRRRKRGARGMLMGVWWFTRWWRIGIGCCCWRRRRRNHVDSLINYDRVRSNYLISNDFSYMQSNSTRLSLISLTSLPSISASLICCYDVVTVQNQV